MKKISVEELAQLLRYSYKLECLEAAGVDNWEGYDYAVNEKDEDGLSYRDYFHTTDEELTKDYEDAD